MAYQSIGVVGAGSWGTALAITAALAGRDVTLWARRSEHAATINATLANERYLPGVSVPGAIRVTSNPSDLAECDAALLAVPAQTMREVSERFSDHLPVGCLLVSCAKGIEISSGLLMSQLLRQTIPGRPVAVLSGPTFAGEVAQGLPTAVSLACDQVTVAEELAKALATPGFRPYSSGDIVGIEVAGAMKNVIAIACGIVIGMGLGENARASLVTRGLVEIRRLAVAKGGFAPSVTSLGGIGDLMLTCASGQSRNYQFGLEIGSGRPLSDAMGQGQTVLEGAATARSLPAVAHEYNVDLPIGLAVAQLLNGEASLDDLREQLLGRPLSREGGQ